jgi:flagellar basal-body rod modification protein FlgD
MSISALSSPSTTSSSSSSSSSASGLTSAAEQQDRFMRLLVAQMKNQDPLNPMDNAQMTSQIAQINTVAGLEKLNKTVEGLVGGFMAMQNQSAIQLAGRDVMVAGNRLRLSDGKAQAGVELSARADRLDVEIIAPSGQVVQAVSLGASSAGIRTFSWDGQMADGTAAPDGDYRVRVSATAAGKPVDATVLSAVRVQSVIPSPSGVQLDLGSAGIASWGDIRSFL